MKTIAIASDHAGVDLKKVLVDYLQELGYKVLDFGTNSYESVDYPDYIRKVPEAILSGEADAGIVICGSGIGASLVANKYKGIRAALCFNEYMAKYARLHNNAQILALGARVIGQDLAKSIVATFLSHGFEGGRHQRRLDKLAAIEDEQCR